MSHCAACIKEACAQAGRFRTLQHRQEQKTARIAPLPAMALNKDANWCQANTEETQLEKPNFCVTDTPTSPES